MTSTRASAMGSFLCPPGYAGPRGLRALARESSAVAEAARWVRFSAQDRRERRERPYALRPPERNLAPVVLVPGFMAGDGSLLLMSRHLRGVGHRTYRSTMHANVGCSQAASEALERRVEMVATRRERKVSIVGHSLGGLLARGVAARRPDLVGAIVTLGSPLLAPGAAHPLLLLDLAVIVRLRRLGLGGLMGEDCTSGECARTSWELARLPLHPDVAFTSIYSRRDGIVDWRSCLDPQAESTEVTTSHLGMALDPAVFARVTRALAPARDGSAARDDARGASSLRTPATLAAVPDASVG